MHNINTSHVEKPMKLIQNIGYRKKKRQGNNRQVKYDINKKEHKKTMNYYLLLNVRLTIYLHFEK